MKYERVVMLSLAALAGANGVTGAELHVIGAVDFSGTEKAVGFGAKSQFQENMIAASQLLANLPAGGRITMIGITDQTLANPLLLLSARLADDSGYFGSRLAAGRRDLLTEWTTRTKASTPIAPHTDIIGGFMYASEVFSRSKAERKVLVFFSDMRNEQPGVLDLENPDTINVENSIKNLEKRGLIAPLPGVEIYIFGAGDHAGKKPPEYGMGLKAWFTEYIRRSGGRLRVFSTSRDIDALREIVAPGNVP